MAENLMKLKRKAVSLGMDAKHARTASRKDLEAFVSEHTESTDAPVKKRKGAVVKKRKTAAAATPAKKRGRPAGSKNKPKEAAATSTKSAPKTTAKKAGRPKKQTSSNGDAGRLTIDKLDYTESEDWNPRKGSPVERIWKALKKSRDNVDKAYDELIPHVKEIVGAKKRNGEKRTKAELEAMLRYRINRTRFEFAVRTGQHEVATNRVDYGTGKYATTRKKKAKAGKK